MQSTIFNKTHPGVNKPFVGITFALNIIAISAFFLLSMIPSFMKAQSPDLSIGHWRSHLPYNTASTVTQSDEKIYFGNIESLVSIDKIDNSTQLFNKVSGLNDAGVQLIRFNPANNILVIVYNNSNIDLIIDGKIRNFNLIKETTSVTGDKSINHIFFDGTDAYFSAAFGIVKMDMTVPEIRYTTFTEMKVNAVEIYNDELYASMNEGIYHIGLNNPEIVMKNFNNWILSEQGTGLPSGYYSNALVKFDNKLYADVNDSIFVFDGNTWTNIFHRQNFYNRFMEAGADRIIISTPCYSCADQVTLLQPSGFAEFIVSSDAVGAVGQAIDDEIGNLWIADTFRGMASVNPEGLITEYNVNGPYSSSVGQIAILNNEVWVASILLSPTWQFKTKSDGFWSYIDGKWTIYRPFEIPELFGYWDMGAIAINPVDGHVFVGSYKAGLIEFDKENFLFYDESNSTISPHATDGTSTRVSGLAFDDQNNLWVSNFGAFNPIVVRKADGTWLEMGGNFNFSQPTDIVIDRNNFKWFAGGNADKGVLVYDSGQSLDDLNDDRFRIVRPSNSELQTDNVRSLAVDLDGNVWVGTTEGPVVFECVSQIFDGNCPGRRPTAEEGGILDYLLGAEIINTIAIDGANRKWFGTNNGVFVLDADARTEVLRFTETNSPLFSNEVVDIAISGESGEVFIGTTRGMMSYRAEATDGGVVFKDVYAFPNPVRPGYEGPIAIKGLVTDADVRITDVSGQLIYEGTALGGQAIWDGKDYNGRRANSGVYLVFMTNRGGTQKLVTKILVLN